MEQVEVARWAVRSELKGMLEGAADLADSEGRIWGQFELHQMGGPEIPMPILAQAIRDEAAKL